MFWAVTATGVYEQQNHFQTVAPSGLELTCSSVSPQPYHIVLPQSPKC